MKRLNREAQPFLYPLVEMSVKTDSFNSGGYHTYRAPDRTRTYTTGVTRS